MHSCTKDGPCANQTLLLALRYATVYTMFPVFSLVLDQDVKPEVALLYPELYKDLAKVGQGAGASPGSPRGMCCGGVGGADCQALPKLAVSDPPPSWWAASVSPLVSSFRVKLQKGKHTRENIFLKYSQ